MEKSHTINKDDALIGTSLNVSGLVIPGLGGRMTSIQAEKTLMS